MLQPRMPHPEERLHQPAEEPPESTDEATHEPAKAHQQTTYCLSKTT
jgi:hypothetical protein